MLLVLVFQCIAADTENTQKSLFREDVGGGFLFCLCGLDFFLHPHIALQREAFINSFYKFFQRLVLSQKDKKSLKYLLKFLYPFKNTLKNVTKGCKPVRSLMPVTVSGSCICTSGWAVVPVVGWYS